MPKNKNVIPHQHRINQELRSLIKPHQPVILWFTGLSGSGKSTIGNHVEFLLNQQYHAHTYLLDGDNIRTGLNNDLGFSDKDRQENIRRIGEVALLMYDAGLIVLTAFISPFQRDRDLVRNLLPENGFWEIFVDCPIEVCEQRDPKGLYQKARLGSISDFTGISSPYETPKKPELILNSHIDSVETCAHIVVEKLIEKQVLQSSTE